MLAEPILKCINVNEEMSLHYIKLLESNTREYKVNC